MTFKQIFCEILQLAPWNAIHHTYIKTSESECAVRRICVRTYKNVIAQCNFLNNYYRTSGEHTPEYTSRNIYVAHGAFRF